MVSISPLPSLLRSSFLGGHSTLAKLSGSVVRRVVLRGGEARWDFSPTEQTCCCRHSAYHSFPSWHFPKPTVVNTQALISPLSGKTAHHSWSASSKSAGAFISLCCRQGSAGGFSRPPGQTPRAVWGCGGGSDAHMVVSRAAPVFQTGCSSTGLAPIHPWERMGSVSEDHACCREESRDRHSPVGREHRIPLPFWPHLRKLKDFGGFILQHGLNVLHFTRRALRKHV